MDSDVAVLLEEIDDRRRFADAADRYLTYAVKRARRNGVSWERIARALGVTRQSATEKYAKACDE